MKSEEDDAPTLSVAIIASSGGGTATLGHTNPPALLETIEEQLRLCHARVGAALFVSLDRGKGMDSANEMSDLATLYQVELDNKSSPTCKLSCSVVKRDTLYEVNQYCREQQQKIAQAIQRGEIHGLICISCHVKLFQQTLQAAAAQNIPVTGSGGTSLSQAASLYELSLLGNAGGSVATTSFTRAVSYTRALALHWGRSYQPWKHSRSTRGPTFTSVLNSCLPIFWAICIAKSVLGTQLLRLGAQMLDLETALDLLMLSLQHFAIPTACCVIMATSCAEGSSRRSIPVSSLIMASVVSSMACSQSLLSGLVAGWLVAQSTDRILYFCIFRNVPATMTNLLTSGGVGVLVMLAMLPVAPILRLLTAQIRFVILYSVSLPDRRLRALGGFIWGCLSCYSSKVGWYHTFFLPGILIEMELGEASFLGAIDELTLVLVCAGICLGNLVSRKLFHTELSSSDVALCRRGLSTNLLCGDFVEVCYPFMDRSLLVNVGGYFASGASSAWLVLSSQEREDVPKSLAYLPVFASIAVANSQWRRMAGASVIAVIISFLATLSHHALSSIKRKKQ
jgi:hypothetical protein